MENKFVSVLSPSYIYKRRQRDKAMKNGDTIHYTPFFAGPRGTL